MEVMSSKVLISSKNCNVKSDSDIWNVKSNKISSANKSRKNQEIPFKCSENLTAKKNVSTLQSFELVNQSA